MARISYAATAYGVWKTLAISAPTVVDALLGRLTVDKCDARLRDWAHAVVARADVRLSVEGVEHVPRGRACVLMSNHQGHFDIPICYVTFPGSLRMVAKEELFRVPIWGRAMREADFIAVDRSGDRDRAVAAMKRAAAVLERGISVWIAPEGTRSRDGRLGRFKRGGFQLAAEMALPIVPMTIDGSRLIIPKKEWWVRRGVHVRVEFGPPIVTAGRPMAEVMADVRRFMSARLGDGTVT
jgi:1-acyl-sn-glycerol-3-phosphate acyltransferase